MHLAADQRAPLIVQVRAHRRATAVGLVDHAAASVIQIGRLRAVVVRAEPLQAVAVDAVVFSVLPVLHQYLRILLIDVVDVPGQVIAVDIRFLRACWQKHHIFEQIQIYRNIVARRTGQR